jgi:hypothetical protein
MKTIAIVLSAILTSSLLYSQSSIVYDVGTLLDVGTGADVCAGTITVNGTYSGSGTFCNAPVAVENEDDLGTPKEFSLMQNYPNPFNPSTTIRYGLPQRSQVTLTVYNTLGQSVSTLVNGDMEAGYHEVKFDGSGLSSGVYFYRMQAGSYVETKKLLLVR